MKRKIILCILILLLFITGCKNNEVNNEIQKKYAIFKVDGKLYKANVLIEDGYILDLPEQPKKEGYIFSHWEYNGKIYDGTGKVEANTIFNAVFEEIEEENVVTVTLEKNNGEEKETIEVKKNEKLVIVGTPKKDGYEFLGWYYNDEVFSFNTEITKDITLQAKWGKNAKVPTEVITKIVYGDVNEDNVVDKNDSIRLLKYLEGTQELTTQGMKNADINNDNVINKVDYDLLLSFLANYYPKTLPEKPITDYVIYGDTNEDGIVDGRDSLRLLKYLEGTQELTIQGMKNADINNDGVVNKIDSTLLLRFLANYYPDTLPEKPITDYAIYGDMNEDGEVGLGDISKLGKYISDKATLSSQQKKNADINGDGKIDLVDVKLIAMYIVYAENPQTIIEPITDYAIYGDLNEDINVDETDASKLLKYLNNQTTLTTQQKKNADVNADGIVDIKDYDLLISYTKYRHYGNILPDKPIKNYVLYGDVNEDGIVDGRDSLRLLKYLDGEVTLSEQAKKNADINYDSEINAVDSKILLAFLGNYYPDTLPYRPIVSFKLYGDINNDGLIDENDLKKLSNYLEKKGELSDQGFYNADINDDSVVNKEDYILLELYLEGNFESTLPYKNIKDYSIYGDMNEDGKVDADDSAKLANYITKNVTLSTQQKKNADINGDGKIDLVDVALINKYIVYAKNSKLITKPLKDYVLYGDINEDGQVTSEDNDLLKKYLDGKVTLSEQAKKNADVNNDGKVNGVDSSLLELYFAHYFVATLPNSPLDDYTIFGDVDENGKVDTVDATVLSKYLTDKVTLPNQVKKNADVNGDGVINQIDVLIIKKFASDYPESLIVEPITGYTFYGDLNNDGFITVEDSSLFEKYLEGKATLSEQTKMNADVNDDGVINQIDSSLLTMYLSDNSIGSLPLKPIKDYIIYGDINEDGKVDMEDMMKLADHVNKGTTLTDQVRMNADVNDDGIVNYVDVQLIRYYIYEKNLKLITKPIKDYVLYGDLNGNGQVTYADLSLLAKYLDGQTKLSDQAKKNADVNNDGKVNVVDLLQLAKHLANWEGHTSLPISPITNYVDYGDINEDGLITSADSDLLEKYLDGKVTLSNQAKKNADVNKDGTIDKKDYDSLLDTVKSRTNLETSTKCGDVNENKEISYADLILLAKYLDGQAELSDQAKKNADVNNDGKVDDNDVIILSKYLANWEGYTSLPVTE